MRFKTSHAQPETPAIPPSDPYLAVMEGRLSQESALQELCRYPHAESLFLAGRNWQNPDHEKLLELLIAARDPHFLYQAGLHWPSLDRKRAEAALLALKDPESLYRAGRAWKGFDTKTALTLLLKQKDSRRIYYAGNDWKTFDFKAGQKALSLLGDGEFLFYAGCHWQEFDFKKGMEALLATGNLKFLFQAGRRWPVFNHDAAWDLFEKKVTHGAVWRASALEDKRWKKALLRRFQNLCGMEFRQEGKEASPQRGPGRWEIHFGSPQEPPLSRKG